jgi:hypothetical protein
MDLKVIESGNGGELVKTARDLEVISGLGNMVYLGLFGGNVAASTPSKRLATEQAFDWTGNSLLFPNAPEQQFNSLTSSGRVRIEQAVLQDLAFMKPFAEVTASVSIPETDKVVIAVQLQEPNNLQEQEFTFIWDASRNELTVE